MAQMGEYRKRLEMLTGEKGIWEDYNPASEEGFPGRSNPDSPQMGGKAPSTHPTSTHIRSSATEAGSYKATNLAIAERSVGTAPSQKYQEKMQANGHSTPGIQQRVDWPDCGLEKGQVSPQGAAFCPWKLVKGYPYMFVGKRNGERAAPFFSTTALHENRVWDFFYIHNLSQTNPSPILFVPTYQFQQLLEFVNARLDTDLKVPGGKNIGKFSVSFGRLGHTPRPRFLGRSTDGETFKALEADIPPLDPTDKLDQVPVAAKDDFLEQLKMIHTAMNRKKNSQRNRSDRVASHKAWGRSIKRVQRYLGLRQKATTREGNVPGPGNSLNLDCPTTSEPEGSVVFIAVDIEAYEFNQDIITEVGLAIFDTLKIRKTPPGKGGRNWIPLIDARHIRIKENAWARNRRHVQGCPANFDFGTSEFVKCKDVATFIARIMEAASSTKSFAAPGVSVVKKRPIVLVFHDSSQDVKYLKALGFDIYKTENIVEFADTRDMCQYIKRAQNSTKLATILESLDLRYRFLHNAGNDAVYTMQAMIGLTIKKRQASLTNARTREKAPQQVESTARYPSVDVMGNEIWVPTPPEPEPGEDEGWSSGGEQSDGGDPVKPINPYADHGTSQSAPEKTGWW